MCILGRNRQKRAMGQKQIFHRLKFLFLWKSAILAHRFKVKSGFSMPVYFQVLMNHELLHGSDPQVLDVENTLCGV